MSLSGGVGQSCAEGFPRRIFLPPVPLADARAANPNFTHLVFGQRDAGFRFDDQHLFFRKDPPAPDQQTFILVARRHRNHAMLVERLPVEPPDRWAPSSCRRP